METPEGGLLVSCLPDTGCTQSIILAELAKRLGATIDNKATIQLLTANGGSISVLGQARLYIQLKDKTTVTYAIVASGVSHPALISWHDLKYLGVISSPSPVLPVLLYHQQNYVTMSCNPSRLCTGMK